MKQWFEKDGSTRFTAAYLSKGLGPNNDARLLRYGNYATSLRGSLNCSFLEKKIFN